MNVSQFNSNLNLNEVIDLFEFKISITNNNELYLLKRLDDAGLEITTLSHQNILLESQQMHLKEQIEELKAVKKRYIFFLPGVSIYYNFLTQIREMQAGLKAIVESQKLADEMNQLKDLIKEKELENQDLITLINKNDVKLSSKDR